MVTFLWKKGFWRYEKLIFSKCHQEGHNLNVERCKVGDSEHCDDEDESSTMLENILGRFPHTAFENVVFILRGLY